MEPQASPPNPGGPAILGLDNVRLELPLAGVGSRTLAASIDHFLLVLLQLLGVTASVAVLPQIGVSQGWVFGLVIILLFVLQWGYFAAFEIALAGRTPGKLAVGLRTVSRHGGRTTPAAILIRNFLRTLDLLVGIPLMAIDRRARRLGDLVAGTLVVHHRPETSPAQLGRHPEGWGAREVAVVEGFLRRAETLDPEVARELADRLIGWIASTEPEFWGRAAGGRAAGEPAPGLGSEDSVRTLRLALEAGG